MIDKELKELKKLQAKIQKESKKDYLLKHITEEEIEKQKQVLEKMFKNKHNRALVIITNEGTSIHGHSAEIVNIVGGFLTNLPKIIDIPGFLLAELLKEIAKEVENENNVVGELFKKMLEIYKEEGKENETDNS